MKDAKKGIVNVYVIQRNELSPEERLLWVIFYHQPYARMEWPPGMPHKEIAGMTLKDALFSALSDNLITNRERSVIRERFGFDSEDHKMLTLEDTGKIFDVQRERIRQIEAKVLRKLRHPSRSRLLKPYAVTGIYHRKEENDESSGRGPS